MGNRKCFLPAGFFMGEKGVGRNTLGFDKILP